jgi:hypothetical protein
VSPPVGGSAAPMGPPGSGPAGPPGEIRIDRLALRVAGLDEDAARSLAWLVAEGLVPGLLRPSGMAGLDSLRVEVRADAAAQAAPELLARRIVGAIGRALARDRVSGGPDGEVTG